jgi:hypothetical protein
MNKNYRILEDSNRVNKLWLRKTPNAVYVMFNDGRLHEVVPYVAYVEAYIAAIVRTHGDVVAGYRVHTGRNLDYDEIGLMGL